MENVDVRSTKTVPTTVQGVGQRSPVVMTWAGPEDEIVISAASAGLSKWRPIGSLIFGAPSPQPYFIIASMQNI